MALAPMPLDTVSPDNSRLGWIGTGVMGASMCSHLLGKGFAGHGLQSHAGQGRAAVGRGSQMGRQPESRGGSCRRGVHHCWFSDRCARNGAGRGGHVGGQPAGQYPGRHDHERARAGRGNRRPGRGARRREPRRSGHRWRCWAREARLSIMVGGDEGAFRKLAPCFEAMGKTIVHHGGPGNGQRVKFANQVLIAANMIAICEGLLFAYRAGLDFEAVMKSVSSGGAGSVALSAYGPRMIAGRFEPGFFVEHFLKDMGIALAEAGRMGLALPGLGIGEPVVPGPEEPRTRARRHAFADSGARVAVACRLEEPQ